MRPPPDGGRINGLDYAGLYCKLQYVHSLSLFQCGMSLKDGRLQCGCFRRKLSAIKREEVCLRLRRIQREQELRWIRVDRLQGGGTNPGRPNCIRGSL